MPISRVIMNASPIICMMKAGIIEVLPALFKDIVVPQEVKREILVRGRTDLKGEVLASYQWIRLVNDIVVAPQVASWDLGQGESAVISFALDNPDFWTVIDDREARRCATALHCRHTGTLGIIVLAKRRGIIPSIRGYIERLKEAGLWLSDELVEQVCRMSGE
jgi:predicted nucleic acid-binding protein